MTTTIPENTKKTYETPRLVVYGDVREITKHNFAGANTDGGLFGGTKTG